MRSLLMALMLLVCSNGYTQSWVDAILPMASALENASENPKTYDLLERWTTITENIQNDSEEVELLEEKVKETKLRIKLLRLEKRLKRKERRYKRKM